MNAESNPEMSAQEWLNKYKRKRGKSTELSYACHSYAHKRCRGVTCKCGCHKNE